MTIGQNHRERRHSFAVHVDHWLTKAKRDAEKSVCTEVIVDLTEIDRINSNDLNELIRLQLHVKNSGRRLVLANVPETVFQVFTLTRLDRLIELRHDGHFEPVRLHYPASRSTRK